MALYSDVDLSLLAYKPDIFQSKATGAKSMFVAPCAGSNERVRFQLGSYDTDFLRAPYGVSTPLPGQEAAMATRRSFDVSIESDAMLSWLDALDERNVVAGVENSQAWFGRPMERGAIEHMYTPIVKRNLQKPEYRPTARTKVLLDGDRKTNILVVTKETPAAAGRAATIDEYVEGTIDDVTKGAKCLVIVETSGLWQAQKSFGMSLQCVSVLVWPTRQTRGIDAFFLGASAPQRALAPPPSAQTIGGDMPAWLHDDETIDAPMADELDVPP